MASSESSLYRVINLAGWTGGVRDQRINPLFFPENCIAGGENCEFSHRGLRTRKGFACVAQFTPWSEIRALYQTRFPTNETKYLVVQVTQPEGIEWSPAGYPRMGHTAVADESSGLIYVWGGGRRYNTFYSGLDTYTASTRAMQIYNPYTNTWSMAAVNEGATMRVGATGILVDGKIYFWGGGNFGYDAVPYFIPTIELNIYDIYSDSWSFGAPSMVHNRQYANVIYANYMGMRMLVFFGGSDWGVHIYNIDQGMWYYASWEDLGGIYFDYCVWRATEDGFEAAPAHIYDGEENPVYGVIRYTWGDEPEFIETTNLPTLPWRPGQGEDSFSGITVGNTTYFWSRDHYIGNHYQDPILESWTFGHSSNRSLAATPHNEDHIPTGGMPLDWMLGWGTANYSAVHLDGKLYYFGGIILNNYWGSVVTNQMCIYDIASNTWEVKEGPVVYDTPPETAAFNKLYACPDHLYGDESLSFTEIYDLGLEAGPISCAVLNDRAVFTEGIANPPLVWGGCMAEDGSDWMYPKAVLVSQDGVNFYDVSSFVCDSDPDTVADIGGINAWGFVAICCDMPKVSGFFIEMNTPNAGIGISTVTETVDLDDTAKVYRRDLKGEIVTWIKDTSAPKALSGPAVDLGGSPNTVKIPCTGHNFFQGDVVHIANTTNYSGNYTLGDQTGGDANNFVIEHAYTAETFTGDDTAQVVIPEGGGHFEGAQRILAGPAVDLEGTPNKVKIPCADHNFIAGDKITIRGTANYDGIYILPSQTSGDEDNFVIESPFNSETFASPDEARKRIVLAPAEPPFSDHLPNHPNDVTPPASASASSTNYGEPYGVFFEGYEHRWVGNMTPTAWIAINLGAGNGFVARAWRWKNFDATRPPKRFRLQGYYNGEWVNLDTSYAEQNYPKLLTNVWTEWFPFVTNLSCEQYRMLITESYYEGQQVEVVGIEIAEYQVPESLGVVRGLLCEFTDSDIDILDIRSTGEGDGAVQLQAEHDTANVLHIYGLEVQDKALCVNRPLAADYVETFHLEQDSTKKFMCGGMHFRQIIPASALTASGDRLRLTLHAGHDTTYGASIRHVSIAKPADAIKIPCPGHGFYKGSVVIISGTQHYDGVYTLPDQSLGDVDNIIIYGGFRAETFGPDAQVTQSFWSRGMNWTIRYVDAPAWYSFSGLPSDVAGRLRQGQTIQIIGSTYWDGIFTLSETPNYPLERALDGTGRNAQYENFSTEQAYLYQLGPTKSISGDASLAGSATGTMVAGDAPTILTFGGSESVNIPVGGTATTDWADFRYLDEETDLLVIIDCEWGTVTGWGGGSVGTIQRQDLAGATTYYYLATSSADNPKRDSFDTYDPYAGDSTTRKWYYPYQTLANTVVGVFSIEVKQQQVLPTGLYVATTADAESLDISYIQSFQGIEVTQTAPGDTKIFHAVSLDSKRTFQVFLNDVWRTIVRQDGATWQYKDAAGAWQNASINTRLGALEDAFAVTENQMTGGQLAAVTPEQWVDTGGIVLYQTSNLDFAVGMQIDGLFWPSLSRYAITYKTEGASITEGWKQGGWSEGEGWWDNTELFAQSGMIGYNGVTPFEADYSVLSEVPGFWYRIKMKGTSPGTSITRVRYRAPCQPLSNIGDGQPDIVLGFIHQVAETGNVFDWAVPMSDYTVTEFASASMPLKVGDYLYAGYVSRFSAMRIWPYIEANTNAATLLAEYWNGGEWKSLTIVDKTSVDGATLATQGLIQWSMPDDWRMCIPLQQEGMRFERGYWLRFHVSADLSETTKISEARVYPVPDPIKKHREAVAVRDRIALINRPDASDQVDVSRALEEYGFCGQDSGSYRVGGQDGIASVIAAWNGLFLGKTDTWHQLVGATPADFSFQSIEAARHIPINSRCIVKAPIDPGDGNRYGLFFLNAYGAFAASGLHVDSLWNSGRGQLLSDSVTWWTATENPRLDLDHLHLAWGVYWPAENWIIWAVPMRTGDALEQTSNNRLIVYDLTFGTWLPPFTISLASMTTAYHHNSEAPGKLGPVALYGGDHQGRILRLFDPEQTTDDQQIISAWIETGWLHFGSPEYRKILRFLTLYGSATGDVVKLEAFTDGEESVVHTLQFRGLSDLEGRCFGEDQLPENLAGRFFKFRLSFNDMTAIYGLQIGTSIVREWGAV